MTILAVLVWSLVGAAVITIGCWAWGPKIETDDWRNDE